jgi:recombination protein RecT
MKKEQTDKNTQVAPSKPATPAVVTHVAQKPNTRPPTQIEVLRSNMEGEFLKTVTYYYSGNEQDALMFKTAAVDYVRRIPKLLECDRLSLLSAFAQVAQFRFMPSGVSGEAYIIPYGKEAKFQLGYQGIVTLLYRTNKIRSISANIIYENDIFEYEEGLDSKLIHKPAMFGKPKGDAIGVYTVVSLTGGQKTFKVMDKDAVLAIKNLSKAKASKESPWNSDKDPEMWMWKKTCLIQHSKLLPKTKELQRAIEQDIEGEGMERSPLDAGGPAVGVSSHDPKNFLPAPETEVIPEGEPDDEMSEEEKADIIAQEKKDAEQGTIEM